MSLHLLAPRRILNLKTPTIKKELQSQKRTWLSFFKSFSNFFYSRNLLTKNLLKFLTVTIGDDVQANRTAVQSQIEGGFS